MLTAIGNSISSIFGYNNNNNKGSTQKLLPDDKSNYEVKRANNSKNNIAKNINIGKPSNIGNLILGIEYCKKNLSTICRREEARLIEPTRNEINKLKQNKNMYIKNIEKIRPYLNSNSYDKQMILNHNNIIKMESRGRRWIVPFFLDDNYNLVLVIKDLCNKVNIVTFEAYDEHGKIKYYYVAAINRGNFEIIGKELDKYI